jgi:hypothetical protein
VRENKSSRRRRSPVQGWLFYFPTSVRVQGYFPTSVRRVSSLTSPPVCISPSPVQGWLSYFPTSVCVRGGSLTSPPVYAGLAFLLPHQCTQGWLSYSPTSLRRPGSLTSPPVYVFRAGSLTSLPVCIPPSSPRAGLALLLPHCMCSGRRERRRCTHEAGDRGMQCFSGHILADLWGKGWSYSLAAKFLEIEHIA